MEKTTDRNWMVACLVVASLGLLLAVHACSRHPAYAAGVGVPAKESVLATGFADAGDKWAGTVFICLYRRGAWKRIDNRTPGIAHRTRKCGSRVKVTNRRTGRSVWTRVIDAGPYWLVPTSCARDATDRGGFRFASHACWRKGRAATKRERASKPRAGWCYASGADLTPPIRRAIGHNGLEPVDLEWR